MRKAGEKIVVIHGEQEPRTFQTPAEMVMCALAGWTVVPGLIILAREAMQRRSQKKALRRV